MNELINDHPADWSHSWLYCTVSQTVFYRKQDHITPPHTTNTLMCHRLFVIQFPSDEQLELKMDKVGFRIFSISTRLKLSLAEILQQ